jgi:hypothetical protein
MAELGLQSERERERERASKESIQMDGYMK